jgi:hypothetical protein
MTKLDNLRAFYERRARGERVYKLCLEEVGVECLLEAAGLLPPDNDDPRVVEQALTRFIQLAIDESGFSPAS